MKRLLHVLQLVGLMIGCLNAIHAQTEITKWQYNKKAAVSITYDDGSINQFRYALPIMKRLSLPATFYIITGPILGSKYQGKFIGRPVEKIIQETANISTNKSNYFERASAAKYLDCIGAFAYYDKSAILFEDGKEKEAYKVMDSLYQNVRNNTFKRGIELSDEVAGENGLTWDSIKLYASQGYEFASHTITHAHMAVLDTANMFYELRKSKEDIKNHLNATHTFCAEIPFGIEHPRALKYALPSYDALRNLMTDEYMQEINRGYTAQPGESTKAYVQWQRGPLSKTPLSLMKSWVDTAVTHNNIWLVLVFHGVDSLGWEALPHEVLDTCFQYIKQKGSDLWIATFSDVARYMRERTHSSITVKTNDEKIIIVFHHSLDETKYYLPLTLKTYLPPDWKKIKVTQGNTNLPYTQEKDARGTYILYQAYNKVPVKITTE
jgi:peptidoglycan/xylan/chitin deacetylase (PgdA/CDA1 family)